MAIFSYFWLPIFSKHDIKSMHEDPSINTSFMQIIHLDHLDLNSPDLLGGYFFIWEIITICPKQITFCDHQKGYKIIRKPFCFFLQWDARVFIYLLTEVEVIFQNIFFQIIHFFPLEDFILGLFHGFQGSPLLCSLYPSWTKWSALCQHQ